MERINDVICRTVYNFLKDRIDEIITFNSLNKDILYEILDKLGEMPLPPYIHEKLEDRNRYQTVYAREEGSAAAEVVMPPVAPVPEVYSSSERNGYLNLNAYSTDYTVRGMGVRHAFSKLGYSSLFDLTFICKTAYFNRVIS